jgi:membrane-bound lytic murein transglycosylase A
MRDAVTAKRGPAGCCARAWISLFAAGFMAACVTVNEKPVPAMPVETRFDAAGWTDLQGWQQDALADAWPALQASCRARMVAAWKDFCTEAARITVADSSAQRQLIEVRLRPWHVVSVSGDARHRVIADAGLVTGYYEPLLNGARRRGGLFQTPLYAVPDDLLTLDLAEAYPQLAGTRVRGKLQGKRVVPYPDRAQLADGRSLAGRELLWVDSSIDAFFLQIQGSGRVKLDDGSTVRLAFADVNGRPYRAIGRYLVDKGEMTVEQATAPALREWLASHPDRQQEVFNQNPSVVFFREEVLADASVGPKGALGVPLTPGRSVAIDPALLPLGAPLFLSTLNPLSGTPLQRLVMAQDTGGAIRGAPRADLFWGWEPEAAQAAGVMRAQGSLWLLWPAGEMPPLPQAASRPAPN